ncbi:MAG: hypothetical protein Q7K57_07300 [Burkholderiaceae bacterium]|nr:hypothetical protein [Burkholderiaceae bacterium]
MRENFTADWAFGIRGAIENIVRSNFPQDLRSWPLLQSFDFEAYSLPENYVLLILKDKLSGIPAGPGVCSAFPHGGLPVLPPKVSDIELWQFYLRIKFSLREEDAPFLVPVKDSGRNDASKDYVLFSAEEQLFWNRQISYVVSRYKSHLQSMTKQSPVQPPNITYNLSGTGARVNINSTDSSVNVISTEVSKVFAQVREAVGLIPDPTARSEIGRAVDEMEQAHGSSNFLQKYQAFITSAANHMTVLAPIIPAVTGLLT